MKKNRIITMSLREIKTTKKRFFSLCVLSILGVSFFVGMKMSGPTMIKSLDKYYDSNKIYDLKIISTLGLEEEDIKEIEKLNNNYKVVGSHTKDALFNDGKYESVLRIHEINKDMNNIIITKGRLPQNKNEIVVEDGILYKTDYKIGDKIKLKLDSDDTSLNSKELEIVGIVLSPAYVNNNEVTQSRGNTTIGNGQVAYYSYALKDLFNIDYYTEIYVQDNNATKFTTNSKDYQKRIETDEKQISTIKDTRQKARYTKLFTEANNKINEEFEKGNSKLNEAKEKLEQSKEQLENGKKQLDNAKYELDQANLQIQRGKRQLKESKEQLAKGKEQLNTGKNEIENKIKDYNITYDKLANFVKKYDSSSFSINDIINLFSDNNIDIKKNIEESLVNIKSIANSYGINLEALFNRYGINTGELLQKTDIKLNEVLDVITVNQLKEIILDEEFITLIKESIPKNSAYYNEIDNYLKDFSNTKENIIKLFAGVREIENGYIEYNNNLNLINTKEKELNRAIREYENSLNK